MTGLLPSTSGIYGQLSDVDIRKASAATENITFMSEYFAQHGYKTMGIGKIFHNGAPEGSFQEYGQGRWTGIPLLVWHHVTRQYRLRWRLFLC